MIKERHATQGLASGIKSKSVEPLWILSVLLEIQRTGKYTELHHECE